MRRLREILLGLIPNILWDSIKELWGTTLVSTVIGTVLSTLGGYSSIATGFLVFSLLLLVLTVLAMEGRKNHYQAANPQSNSEIKRNCQRHGQRCWHRRASSHLFKRLLLAQAASNKVARLGVVC
jgi:hypothetical protein